MIDITKNKKSQLELLVGFFFEKKNSYSNSICLNKIAIFCFPNSLKVSKC